MEVRSARRGRVLKPMPQGAAVQLRGACCDHPPLAPSLTCLARHGAARFVVSSATGAGCEAMALALAADLAGLPLAAATAASPAQAAEAAAMAAQGPGGACVDAEGAAGGWPAPGEGLRAGSGNAAAGGAAAARYLVASSSAALSSLSAGPRQASARTPSPAGGPSAVPSWRPVSRASASPSPPALLMLTRSGPLGQRQPLPRAPSPAWQGLAEPQQQQPQPAVAGGLDERELVGPASAAAAAEGRQGSGTAGVALGGEGEGGGGAVSAVGEEAGVVGCCGLWGRGLGRGGRREGVG
jgi:hypothetical protein